MSTDPKEIVVARLTLLIRRLKDILEEPIRELAAANADDGYNVAELRDVTTRLEQALVAIATLKGAALHEAMIALGYEFRPAPIDYAGAARKLGMSEDELREIVRPKETR